MCDSTDLSSPGRPPALDHAKRQKIIAMVANGSSRRIAAAYVGCATSTITRSAARDPDFAAELNRAEQNSEIIALRSLHSAARNGRYWRAAAWLLERKNPDDFAPRQPEVFTEPQLRQLFLRLMLFVADDMPEQKFAQVMRKLDVLVEMLQKDGDLGPPSLPSPESDQIDYHTEPPDPDLDAPTLDETPIPGSPPSTGVNFATPPAQVVDNLGEAHSP
jgi:hypothetical protein